VETDLAEVGSVLEVGDGIARVYGLENAVSLEMLEFEHGVTASRSTSRRTTSAPPFREWEHVKEGEVVKRTGRVTSIPVGEALIGRIVIRSASRSTARARSRPPGPARRSSGARRGRPPAGQGAAPDRPEGDRLDDSDRPWPARLIIGRPAAPARPRSSSTRS